MRVSRSSCSVSVSSTSFGSDTTPYTELFKQYDLLTRSNPGWSLTEIRELAYRERVFWLKVAIVLRGVPPMGARRG